MSFLWVPFLVASWKKFDDRYTLLITVPCVEKLKRKENKIQNTMTVKLMKTNSPVVISQRSLSFERYCFHWNESFLLCNFCWFIYLNMLRCISLPFFVTSKTQKKIHFHNTEMWKEINRKRVKRPHDKDKNWIAIIILFEAFPLQFLSQNKINRQRHE